MIEKYISSSREHLIEKAKELPISDTFIKDIINISAIMGVKDAIGILTVS